MFVRLFRAKILKMYSEVKGSYGPIRLKNVESKSTHLYTSQSFEDVSVHWESSEKILVSSITPIDYTKEAQICEIDVSQDTLREVCWPWWINLLRPGRKTANIDQ